MRVKIDGGFVSAKREDSGNIGLSIGCEHYNADGTRDKTIVNTATLTEAEIISLFKDVFSENITPENYEENEEKSNLDVESP